MQWQREERLKVRGEKKVDGMSTLHIPRAQPLHMGRYICLEESSQETASVYIYVKGRWKKPSFILSLFFFFLRECAYKFD